jgi:hypothetical protein
MEKSSGDNPAYRHSKSEDDNSGGYSLSIPEVTVSDYNGGEQSYNTLSFYAQLVICPGWSA